MFPLKAKIRFRQSSLYRLKGVFCQNIRQPIRPTLGSYKYMNIPPSVEQSHNERMSIYDTSVTLKLKRCGCMEWSVRRSLLALRLHTDYTMRFQSTK